MQIMGLRIRPWAAGEIASGQQVEQWLGGMIGGTLTLLGCFLAYPVWWLITNRWKIEFVDGSRADWVHVMAGVNLGILPYLPFLVG